MEVIIPVVIGLAILSIILGRAHNSSLARKIGKEVRRQAPHRQTSQEDPIVLLEKLHRLKEAGALTDAEYEAQKARILGA